MIQRLAVPIISLALYGTLHLSGLLTVLANNTMDLLFHLRGPRVTAQSIVIIGVDEESLDRLGTWPFPRRYHTRLLSRLIQARAVGFDFLLAEPTADDPELVETARSGPPVVLAVARTRDQRLLAPAPLLDVLQQGHIETILSGDGVVRRVRLRGPGGQTAFGVALLQAAGLTPAIPPDNQPLLINYYGPEHTFLYLSYSDVLNGNYPLDFFKDRLVLIGARALGLGDVHITPFSLSMSTPGIEIQATVINNLLDDSFIRQVTAISWFLVAAVSLSALFLWPLTGEKRNLWVILLMIIAGCTSTALLFHQNVFIDISGVLIFLVITYLFHLLHQLFWTANRIFHEINYLDHQLRKGLEQVYTNIPKRIIHEPLSKDLLPASGAQQWLDRLQSGIKALSLQHHFLEDLLTKELPPLILWERNLGQVIFTNTMFDQFWTTCAPDIAAVPDFQVFARTLQGLNLEKDTGERLQLDDLKKGGAAIAVDIRTPPGGQRRYYRVHLHPLSEGDTGLSGVIAIFSDVTEIRELERVKDEIVSIVSHELKLPLTTIQGYGEMLTDLLQHEEKEFAEEICSQTKRLNRLIEDFLDIARLENSRQALRQLPFDFLRLIEEAADLTRHSAEQKSIAFEIKTPKKISPCMGDSQLLRQALVNLLDNAVKFSPARTMVTITLIEQRSSFFLEVADQGPGISPEEQAAIFDKFSRGSQQTREKGFGLGLNFVKQVIERHNGTITLAPAAGAGAVFQIKVPKQPHACA